LNFFHDKGMQAALAGVVIWVYLNFRRNTRAEIEVMAAMFSPSQTPQRWDRVQGWRGLIGLTAMWIAITLVLVWSIDRPQVFSATVMMYSLCNVIGMVLYRKNITQHLFDPRFVPPEKDEHRKFILRRRQIQSVYMSKPHHWKEFMLFSGAAIAFITARPSSLPLELWTGTPFAILITVMLLNERIVGSWRRQREQGLIAVQADQIRSDIDRFEH
jgi:hypothetical protein